VDANGSTLYPDIDTSVNAGSMVVPKPYQVKFVKRENALV
jgi:hypothetical protein